MAPPLKLAIAGANAERGWAKDAHIPALNGLPQFAIHAVSARTQDGADAAAAVFGAARAYGDTLAMVRDPEVDVVAVTCKVPEHHAIVMAALEAGKHLYCEWPLGQDLAQAREMAQAARKAGTHVAIGLQGANAIATRHAAKLVREGLIGDLMNLRVVSSTAGWGRVAPPFYAYLQDKANGATLATIAGGHTLAMVEAVVGDYARVSAQNSILVDKVQIAGTDEMVARTCTDHMLIMGRHAGGCVSSVEILSGDAIPLRFELRGSKGKLTIEGYHPGGFQCGALTVTTTLDAEAQPAPPVPAPPVPGLEGQAINVSQIYARLASDIRSGERTVPDFDRAVRLASLLDAIDVASDEGRSVTL